MKTDLNYIKKLVKILDSCDISEIEIEEEGTKLRVVKNKPSSNETPQFISYTPQMIPAGNVPLQQMIEPSAAQAAEKVEEKSTPAENYYEVRSPIVGTFYRAPSPNADPYVQVGQIISKGGVLCIIEAMKLMNEIESEVSGKIVKILVENGKPVEYNQLLFLIEQM